MAQDARQPLSFRSVRGRFRLIEVQYVEYSDGKGFFAVSRPDHPQPMPLAASLRCFVAKHSDAELIPVGVIENWMHRLQVTDEETATFWAVQDLGPAPTQTDLDFFQG